MVYLGHPLNFGHTNIIKYCNRPFESIQEMDAELIRRWNVCVKPDDKVYHLGDFCRGDKKKYLSRLNGQITVLKGSHDKDFSALHLDSMLTISPIKDEYGNPRSIVMCHYAMRSWHHSHYASWHLFGHHHGRLEPYGLSFDVGVDCWNYYPVSLEEVAKKMKTLVPFVDYRKNGQHHESE